MTKLVDDVAEAIEGYHGQMGARYAARDAIAVFEKWVEEKFPAFAHIVKEEIKAELNAK